MYCKINHEKTRKIIQMYRYDTILSFLFNFKEGKTLHKRKLNKREALEAVSESETIILDSEEDLSILSLYSTVQENEKEIKLEGVKLDLLILGDCENLFEKLPEKG